MVLRAKWFICAFLAVTLCATILLHRRIIGLDALLFENVAGSKDELNSQVLAYRYEDNITKSSDVNSSSFLDSLVEMMSGDRKCNEEWLESYFTFHADSRRRFPGKSILTDPAAPSVLLRYCGNGGRTKNYFCGGLSDRLSTLSLDLFLANMTKRILLIHWSIPHSLESFLIPSGDVDWTVPGESGLDEASISRLPTFDVGYDFLLKDKYPGLFARAVGDLVSSTEKIYKISTPSTGFGNKFVTDHLIAQGSTEGNRLFEPPLFGCIFHRFFRPNDDLKNAIDDAVFKCGLKPGHYSAVHLRLRHPLGWGGKKIVGRDGKSTADRSGMPFSGSAKSYAIKIGTNAIECAMGNPPPPSSGEKSSVPEPIYLFSDSNDTVAIFVDPKTNPLRSDRRNGVNIISRNVSSESLHLAYQGSNKSPEAFYGIFIDLFIAVGARCITYGIGGFGELAWRISGTNCTARHRQLDPYPPGISRNDSFCDRNGL